MPIRLFLNGENFDQETTRVMGVALEMTWLALRTGDCAYDVKQAIANKIIALAKTGERDLQHRVSLLQMGMLGCVGLRPSGRVRSERSRCAVRRDRGVAQHEPACRGHRWRA